MQNQTLICGFALTLVKVKFTVLLNLWKYLYKAGRVKRNTLLSCIMGIAGSSVLELN